MVTRFGRRRECRDLRASARSACNLAPWSKVRRSTGGTSALPQEAFQRQPEMLTDPVQGRALGSRRAHIVERCGRVDQEPPQIPYLSFPMAGRYAALETCRSVHPSSGAKLHPVPLVEGRTGIPYQAGTPKAVSPAWE